jgi:ComF family protein
MCGRPVKTHDVCGYCRDGSWFDHGRAWLYFIPPVNTLIHHFKYRRKKILATLLGRAMASLILADSRLQQADVIAPIPLFWMKRLNRGYNQSSLLCDVIASNTRLPQQEVLKRVRYTRTQTKLSDAARQKNIRGAFSLCSDGIKDRKVILVDDVMTTGATMNECARMLKQAGATAVYSCVAAITP